MHLVDRIRGTVDRLVAHLALVGADPNDDEDLRARKALLVLISVLILPVAAMWGALYLAFGSPVGVVPLLAGQPSTCRFRSTARLPDDLPTGAMVSIHGFPYSFDSRL